ncbi:unnamed protein product [Heligmosomoides polygyrus]|uniref:Reverse transcriptase domain-containing protein n=1 Tax=Heligmosomoides polygyrus TaxID=6339 RepID=A0A3P7YV74_HELPZ|nr:unnamed protein product [Heligmosomoides polygyrus]
MSSPAVVAVVDYYSNKAVMFLLPLRTRTDTTEEISNVKFAHSAIPFAPPIYGPVPKITVSETEAALRKTNSGKATALDDLPANLWKSKSWCPADWLTAFFNQVVAEKKVPEGWQQSTTIPIWKKKGSPADCASYRPIRLLSHTMKIFERIVDGRIRDVVQLSTNQCGFVSGCGTVDAIHAVRLLLEKHREKQKPVHFAFLDLEKAFDCVPREVIWYALREHGVPEELIEAVVRAIATYGAECRPVTKEIESRLSVTEMKMLRFGVAPIGDKLREARLRWYGHVLRTNDDTIRKMRKTTEVS